MNDRWRKKDGNRWNDPEKVRVARMFRHHVQTRRNPKGRIVRLPCAFADHPDHREECISPAGPATEFAHVDYSRPFFGTWACAVAHRRLEHGSLKLTQRRTFDYSSLVAPIVKPGLRRERRLRLVPTGSTPF